MAALHRRLPRKEQYPLPPRTITMRAAQTAGIQHKLDDEERFNLSLAAHFAMGATAGAEFAFLPRQHVVAGIFTGVSYGVAVWAVNYLGILPALGLLSPATRHPPRRTAVMIAAHAVWGAAVGGLVSLSRPVSQDD
jgi:hypothetical protein